MLIAYFDICTSSCKCIIRHADFSTAATRRHYYKLWAKTNQNRGNSEHRYIFIAVLYSEGHESMSILVVLLTLTASTSPNCQEAFLAREPEIAVSIFFTRALVLAVPITGGASCLYKQLGVLHFAKYVKSRQVPSCPRAALLNLMLSEWRRSAMEISGCCSRFFCITDMSAGIGFVFTTKHLINR